ncbi:MAG: hypothetical protein P9L99_16540 [Candidatus Lernaella stagnicola]|nr:hypothetical protein [Candidatus Lernaella stagnicola]
MYAKRLMEIRDAFFGGVNLKMAATLEIPESTLRSWLSGRQTPNGEVLTRICTIVNVAPKWLLLGEGRMLREEEPVDPHTLDVEQRLGITIYSRGSQRLSKEFVTIAERELARLIRDRVKRD